MSQHSQDIPVDHENLPIDRALVIPLQMLDRTTRSLAGGKAANLGELMRAGFCVPAGFCITTAAYEQVSATVALDIYLAELETLARSESARQIELAQSIRTALCQTPLPTAVSEAITSAYQMLAAGSPIAVAVRSSATTEDLPDASFAGQQETMLNVIGSEAVLSAVQHCFASLWTDRAIQYRRNLDIAPRTVSLAIVVQRMVEAEVAGVLFTANPITGKRHQAVIDANPGLGVAVVSGATNPDHFVVQTTTGTIVERRLGDKQVLIQARTEGGIEQIERGISPTRSCLSDEQVRALTALGAQVEARFGAPQDIEWAIDPSGQISLLQARPITTLFPLPNGAPATDEELHVYLAFGVQQGSYRPFTPLGMSALRYLSASFLALIGSPLPDPLTGPHFATAAASRPFFDVTTALRSAFGRRFLLEAMREAEVHAAGSFEQLITDPRLSLRSTSLYTVGRALALLLTRTAMPLYLLQAFLAPGAASRRVRRLVKQLHTMYQIGAPADAATNLAEAESLLWSCVPLAFRVSPVMLAGMLSFALAQRLLGDLASASECQRVLGGSPTNPTTEMNLALWRLSQVIQADTTCKDLLQQTSVTHLAQDYLHGQLPALLQQGLAAFLQEYGHQSVCELDLGVARWSEDPTYVLTLLANYLNMTECGPQPEQQRQRAREAAQAMVATLSRRARQKHWLRGWLVHVFLQRAYMLAGFREMTRFVIGLRLAQARALLRTVGEALTQKGKLQAAEDLFFLTLPEVHAALTGASIQTQIRERRAAFTWELGRRAVPLVLLSDGTEPSVQQENCQSARQEETLQGIPASAGRVTAPARVIFDPHTAQLAPGEILVAPSTDPGWTPLFLTAAGLVMEVGGAMAHGAIVAREYGIPAAVGVADATRRITTGSRVTIDGTTGTVMIEPGE